MESDEIMRLLGEVKQQAMRDQAFRTAILADPVRVLQKCGLRVDAGTSVVVEYHEAYGLFIAIPAAERAVTTGGDTSSSTTLLDHPADDCLHY